MRRMLSCPNTSSWRSGISFCSTRIHTSFEAFKLANYYMFGKPVTTSASRLLPLRPVAVRPGGRLLQKFLFLGDKSRMLLFNPFENLLAFR
jgi:hypothetical protein